jgi:tRNA (guanine10-N2)-dimethyltransferase
MITGCTKTLDHYSLSNYQLFCCDIGDIPSKVAPVDAVVTDFPYGKATTTKGEQITILYNRAFEAIATVLKKDGRAVVGLADSDLIPLGQKHLTLLDVFPFRVHKSLTRYFAVYQK